MRAATTSSPLEGRTLLTVIIVGAVALSLVPALFGGNPIHPGGAASLGAIVSSLFSPDLSLSFLLVALEASWTTVAYAVTGMTVAFALGFPLGIAASGVLARSRRGRLAVVPVVRFALAVMRSVHELVWAWLLVIAIGFSPMAAIIALGVPYGGILGRIFAETLADVPEEPLRALRATGASELKVLLYGRLPMAMPDLLGYTFYRFECAIRSAAIFSFVGIAGLGYQLQLSLDDLLFDQVWTLLFSLVALVALVDLWSSVVRRSLTR